MMLPKGNFFHLKLMACCLLMAFLFALLSGCAGTYARYTYDDVVTRMFQENSVPDQYVYYIDGKATLPYVIIGIDPGYQWDNPKWVTTEPNTETFARQVLYIYKPENGTLANPQGAWLHSPDGERIGIWYSRYPKAVIRVFDDKRVQVSSPYNPSE